jgi:dipeptidyl aminopeptidase/acylaminoacyl peptidase
MRGDRIVPRNGHATITDAASGRARVLIVEKPGVVFLDDPAPGDPGSDAFRREHTLERWAAAIIAAAEAARAAPGIDPARTLVLGHSEGGLVACRIAAQRDWVTHVACLAGGGPTQLFDLIALARDGTFFAETSANPEIRTAHVRSAWERILETPHDADAIFFGHAYPRWATFLAASPMEELLKTDARLYIAQGALDPVVTRASFEALHAHLLAHGREVSAKLVPGADHSFSPVGPEADQADGWRAIMDDVITWWLAVEHAR